MQRHIISVSSITYALKGRDLLRRNGLKSYIEKKTNANGNINFDDVVANGDCILGIGHYGNSANLTLDSVKLEANNYSSAFALIYVYNDSELNITKSTFEVKNEKYNVIPSNGLAAEDCVSVCSGIHTGSNRFSAVVPKVYGKHQK